MDIKRDAAPGGKASAFRYDPWWIKPFVMNNNKIIYSRNIEDMQIIALEEIGRELTDAEIMRISAVLGDYINWHEAVSHAILDNVKSDSLS
jgi:hypothetical protein